MTMSENTSMSEDRMNSRQTPHDRHGHRASHNPAPGLRQGLMSLGLWRGGLRRAVAAGLLLAATVLTLGGLGVDSAQAQTQTQTTCANRDTSTLSWDRRGLTVGYIFADRGPPAQRCTFRSTIIAATYDNDSRTENREIFVLFGKWGTTQGELVPNLPIKVRAYPKGGGTPLTSGVTVTCTLKGFSTAIDNVKKVGGTGTHTIALTAGESCNLAVDVDAVGSNPAMEMTATLERLTTGNHVRMSNIVLKGGNHFGGTVGAPSNPNPYGLTVEVQPKSPVEADQKVLLLARVTAPASAPISDLRVDFQLDQSDFRRGTDYEVTRGSRDSQGVLNCEAAPVVSQQGSSAAFCEVKLLKPFSAREFTADLIDTTKQSPNNVIAEGKYTLTATKKPVDLVFVNGPASNTARVPPLRDNQKAQVGFDYPVYVQVRENSSPVKVLTDGTVAVTGTIGTGNGASAIQGITCANRGDPDDTHGIVTCTIPAAEVTRAGANGNLVLTANYTAAQDSDFADTSSPRPLAVPVLAAPTLTGTTATFVESALSTAEVTNLIIPSRATSSYDVYVRVMAGVQPVNAGIVTLKRADNLAWRQGQVATCRNTNNNGIFTCTMNQFTLPLNGGHLSVKADYADNRGRGSKQYQDSSTKDLKLTRLAPTTAMFYDSEGVGATAISKATVPAGDDEYNVYVKVLFRTDPVGRGEVTLTKTGNTNWNNGKRNLDCTGPTDAGVFICAIQNADLPTTASPLVVTATYKDPPTSDKKYQDSTTDQLTLTRAAPAKTAVELVLVESGTSTAPLTGNSPDADKAAVSFDYAAYVRVQQTTTGNAAVTSGTVSITHIGGNRLTQAINCGALTGVTGVDDGIAGCLIPKSRITEAGTLVLKATYTPGTAAFEAKTEDLNLLVRALTTSIVFWDNGQIDSATATAGAPFAVRVAVLARTTSRSGSVATSVPSGTGKVELSGTGITFATGQGCTYDLAGIYNCTATAPSTTGDVTLNATFTGDDGSDTTQDYLDSTTDTDVSTPSGPPLTLTVNPAAKTAVELKLVESGTSTTELTAGSNDRFKAAVGFDYTAFVRVQETVAGKKAVTEGSVSITEIGGNPITPAINCGNVNSSGVATCTIPAEQITEVGTLVLKATYTPAQGSDFNAAGPTDLSLPVRASATSIAFWDSSGRRTNTATATAGAEFTVRVGVVAQTTDRVGSATTPVPSGAGEVQLTGIGPSPITCTYDRNLGLYTCTATARATAGNVTLNATFTGSDGDDDVQDYLNSATDGQPPNGGSLTLTVNPAANAVELVLVTGPNDPTPLDTNTLANQATVGSFYTAYVRVQETAAGKKGVAGGNLSVNVDITGLNQIIRQRLGGARLGCSSAAGNGAGIYTCSVPGRFIIDEARPNLVLTANYTAARGSGYSNAGPTSLTIPIKAATPTKTDVELKLVTDTGGATELKRDSPDIYKATVGFRFMAHVRVQEDGSGDAVDDGSVRISAIGNNNLAQPIDCSLESNGVFSCSIPEAQITKVGTLTLTATYTPGAVSNFNAKTTDLSLPVKAATTFIEFWDAQARGGRGSRVSAPITAVAGAPFTVHVRVLGYNGTNTATLPQGVGSVTLSGTGITTATGQGCTYDSNGIYTCTATAPATAGNVTLNATFTGSANPQNYTDSATATPGNGPSLTLNLTPAPAAKTDVELVLVESGTSTAPLTAGSDDRFKATVGFGYAAFVRVQETAAGKKAVTEGSVSITHIGGNQLSPAIRCSALTGVRNVDDGIATCIIREDRITEAGTLTLKATYTPAAASNFNAAGPTDLSLPVKVPTTSIQFWDTSQRQQATGASAAAGREFTVSVQVLARTTGRGGSPRITAVPSGGGDVTLSGTGITFTAGQGCTHVRFGLYTCTATAPATGPVTLNATFTGDDGKDTTKDYLDSTTDGQGNNGPPLTLTVNPAATLAATTAKFVDSTAVNRVVIRSATVPAVASSYDVYVWVVDSKTQARVNGGRVSLGKADSSSWRSTPTCTRPDTNGVFTCTIGRQDLPAAGQSVVLTVTYEDDRKGNNKKYDTSTVIEADQLTLTREAPPVAVTTRFVNADGSDIQGNLPEKNEREKFTVYVSVEKKGNLAQRLSQTELTGGSIALHDQYNVNTNTISSTCSVHAFTISGHGFACTIDNGLNGAGLHTLKAEFSKSGFTNADTDRQSKSLTVNTPAVVKKDVELVLVESRTRTTELTSNSQDRFKAKENSSFTAHVRVQEAVAGAAGKATVAFGEVSITHIGGNQLNPSINCGRPNLLSGVADCLIPAKHLTQAGDLELTVKYTPTTNRFNAKTETLSLPVIAPGAAPPVAVTTRFVNADGSDITGNLPDTNAGDSFTVYVSVEKKTNPPQRLLEAELIGGAIVLHDEYNRKTNTIPATSLTCDAYAFTVGGRGLFCTINKGLNGAGQHTLKAEFRKSGFTNAQGDRQSKSLTINTPAVVKKDVELKFVTSATSTTELNTQVKVNQAATGFIYPVYVRVQRTTGNAAVTKGTVSITHIGGNQLSSAIRCSALTNVTGVDDGIASCFILEDRITEAGSLTLRAAYNPGSAPFTAKTKDLTVPIRASTTSIGFWDRNNGQIYSATATAGAAFTVRVRVQALETVGGSPSVRNVPGKAAGDVQLKGIGIITAPGQGCTYEYEISRDGVYVCTATAPATAGDVTLNATFAGGNGNDTTKDYQDSSTNGQPPNGQPPNGPPLTLTVNPAAPGTNPGNNGGQNPPPAGVTVKVDVDYDASDQDIDADPATVGDGKQISVIAQVTGDGIGRNSGTVKFSGLPQGVTCQGPGGNDQPLGSGVATPSGTTFAATCTFNTPQNEFTGTVTAEFVPTNKDDFQGDQIGTATLTIMAKPPKITPPTGGTPKQFTAQKQGPGTGQPPDTAQVDFKAATFGKVEKGDGAQQEPVVIYRVVQVRNGKPTKNPPAGAPPSAPTGHSGPVPTWNNIAQDSTGYLPPGIYRVTMTVTQGQGANQQKVIRTFSITVIAPLSTATRNAPSPAANKGRIIVQLQLTGGGKGLTHGFTSDKALGTHGTKFDIAVTGLANDVYADVDADTYTITAADFAGTGYDLDSVSCTGDTNPATATTTDLAKRQATIGLDIGETITCTFSASNKASVATAQKTRQMVADYLGDRNAMLLAHGVDMDSRLNRLRPGGRSGQVGGTLSVNLGKSQDATASAFSMDLRTSLPGDVSVTDDAIAFAASTSRLRQTGLFGADIGDDDDIMSGDIGDVSEASGTPQMRWDVWIEGRIARFDSRNNKDGRFGVVYLGADYLITPDVLIGLMAQYDWLKKDYDTNGHVKGQGWMVGPYAALRFGEALYLDVQARAGRSSNDITPVGTYTDKFKTTRWFVSGKLSGDFDYGDWTIRPGIKVQYIGEKQKAYTDSLGNRIAAQTVSEGDVRAGPRIAYTYNLADGGTLIPWAEFEGVYTFGSKGKFSKGTYASDIHGLSGSIEAGFDWRMPAGAMFSLSGSYDGIGSGSKSYGARARIDIPF